MSPKSQILKATSLTIYHSFCLTDSLLFPMDLFLLPPSVFSASTSHRLAFGPVQYLSQLRCDFSENSLYPVGEGECIPLLSLCHAAGMVVLTDLLVSIICRCS